MAALAEFSVRGFDSATLDAIAVAAGFTKGAVYSNFGSKEDLFYALMDQQIDTRSQLVADVLANLPADASDARTALGTRLTGAIVANREWQLLFMDYWARALRDPDVGARFADHRRQVRASITEAVQQALSSTVTTDVPAEWVTFVLLGLSNGLAIEELAEPGVVPVELIGEVLGRLVTVG
ncbi:TetR family transcriptional regulator [Rhodococcoides trifolii]|uniref:TetR family transcriptional regulator n=1 Tax=Rhodococcoides trifolii TaxID=908250 RepID=A0A917G509_9NOCA|nr:TetR family transcriptional regulator [Rhodococcus trifolii]